jgi:ribonuclease VapC
LIAVDTSALMAIVLAEPASGACIAALVDADGLAISAGTMVEALIVAGQRGVGVQVAGLIDRLGFEVVPVTASNARDIAAAYARWGRGNRLAGLNFGDCFAYDLAMRRGCKLLYVGYDFARTDIASAL